jgi:hypothetical protein
MADEHLVGGHTAFFYQIEKTIQIHMGEANHGKLMGSPPSF